METFDVKISNKELKLVIQLATGNSLKQIAQDISASYYSVQKMTCRLYKKFAVSGRLELIRKCVLMKFIAWHHVKPKFRKRFKNKIEKEEQRLLPPIEPLTQEEIKYLKLVVLGRTQRQLVEEMPLYNIHCCNHIKWEICYKLRARNITHAACIAVRINLLNLS